MQEHTPNTDSTSEQFKATALPNLDLPNITLLTCLGEGKFGKVYLAENQMMQNKVAVKVLQSADTNDKNWKERFQREGQILSRLQHPNIVKFFTYGMSPQGSPYIVMEFLQGKSLDTLVKTEGPLQAERACAIIQKVAEALAFAHANGIVHRDIKPGNIFIKEDGTPVVLDFGISKISIEGSSKLTATAQILGTPAYMSPEQARGAAVVDHQSDQYSLACVLYFLLSGKTLFSGSSELEVLMKHAQEKPELDHLGLSKDLHAILVQALSKDPSTRFAGVAEFSERLKSADLNRKVKAPPKLLKTAITSIAAVAAFGLLILFARNATIKGQGSVIEKANTTVSTEKGEREDLVLLEKAEDLYKEIETQEQSVSYFRKFLATETGKKNPRYRVKALGGIASVLSTKKTQESLELSREELHLLQDPELRRKGILNTTLRETQGAEFVSLSRICQLTCESGKPEESLKYANELEKLVDSSASLKGPKNDVAAAYHKSRAYWQLGQKGKALKTERYAFSLLHGDLVEPQYIWAQFSDAALNRAKNRFSTETDELIEEMLFWLRTRNSNGSLDDKDAKGVLYMHGTILQGNITWRHKADEFLLQAYPIIVSAGSMSAQQRLEFLGAAARTLAPATDKVRLYAAVLSRDYLALLRKLCSERNVDKKAAAGTGEQLCALFQKLGKTAESEKLKEESSKLLGN